MKVLFNMVVLTMTINFSVANAFQAPEKLILEGCVKVFPNGRGQNIIS